MSNCLPVCLSYLIKRTPGLCGVSFSDKIWNLQGVTEDAINRQTLADPGETIEILRRFSIFLT
jgi:hypothetical protein